MISPETTVAVAVKVCKNGHSYPAYHAACPMCRQEYAKRYWVDNKERMSEYRKNYRRKNKQECSDQYVAQVEKTRLVSREFIRRFPEKGVLRAAIERCHNPNNKQYADYGERGITVCERWREDGGYDNFIQDMGRRPSRYHSLDRDDNNRGYAPDNCVWRTMKDQQRNRRNNIVVEYCGESKPLSAWVEELGLSYFTVHSRIVSLGWTPERAFTEPIRNMNNEEHGNLCARAAQWLSKTIGCQVVLTEMACKAVEIPDAIGWKDGISYLVECKTNRDDFTRDKKKEFRRNAQMGMGRRRYYLVPEGLAGAEEVPSGWGLLYAGRYVKKVKECVLMPSIGERSEILLLTSALRRTQLRIDQPLHEWLKWDSANSPIRPTIIPEES